MGKFEGITDIDAILENKEEKIYDEIKKKFNHQNEALAEVKGLRELIDKWLIDKFKDNKETEKEAEEKANEYWTADETKAANLLGLIDRHNHKSDESLEKDYSKSVAKINDVENRYISELIQNVDDCEYDDKEPRLDIYIYKDALVFRYNEKGFNHKNILAITSIGNSDKSADPTKIGEKGRGFKTVFSKHKKVTVQSVFFDFSFDGENVFKPEMKTLEKKIEGSRIIAYFTNMESTPEESGENAENTYDFIKEYFASHSFCFNPLMFTKNIKRISLYKKEVNVNTEKWEDIKHTEDTKEMFEKPEFPQDYKIDIPIFTSEPIDEQKELLKNRFKEWDEEIIFMDSLLEENKIQICIYQVKEKDNLEGYLYTFLPTSIKMNIPFAINAPFLLSENRSYPIFEKPKSNVSQKEWNKHLFERIFSTDGELKNWYEDQARKIGNNIFYYLPDGEFKFTNIESKNIESKDGNVKEDVGKWTEWYNANTSTLLDFKDLKIFCGVKDEKQSYSLKESIFFEDGWMYDFYNESKKHNCADWINKDFLSEGTLCTNPLSEIKEDSLRERAKDYLGEEKIIREEDFIKKLVSKINNSEETTQEFKKNIIKIFKSPQIETEESQTASKFFKIIYDKIYKEDNKKIYSEDNKKIFPYWTTDKQTPDEPTLEFESLGSDLEDEKVKKWFINKTGYEYKKSYDSNEKYLVFNGDGSEFGVDDIFNGNESKFSIINKLEKETRLSEEKEEIEKYIGLKILNSICG